MPKFGKPDATGRSSGKRTAKNARYLRPPKGESWVWITRELLESTAWRALSPNGRRLLDRLMVEHMAHAGTENGNLIVTYRQFADYGLSKNLVAQAIDEAEFLGLIRVQRGGRWQGTNAPSRYLLTWVGDRDGNAPTNEWKRVTPEQVGAWRAGAKPQREASRKPKTRTRNV